MSHRIKRILNSTSYLRLGACYGIRVGRLAMEVEQVVDNVMAMIDEAEEIPKKWENVRSFHLKAVDSVRGFANLSRYARIWIEN